MKHLESYQNLDMSCGLRKIVSKANSNFDDHMMVIKSQAGQSSEPEDQWLLFTSTKCIEAPKPESPAAVEIKLQQVSFSSWEYKGFKTLGKPLPGFQLSSGQFSVWEFSSGWGRDGAEDAGDLHGSLLQPGLQTSWLQLLPSFSWSKGWKPWVLNQVWLVSVKSFI